MSLLDSWYEVFILKFCVWFSPDMALCIIAKHLTCAKNIDPEVLWFVQIQICKPKLCCQNRAGFSPGNPPK